MNEYFMYGEATINMQRRDVDLVVAAKSAMEAREIATDRLKNIEGCTQHVIKFMQKV
ncbi:MAG: hypothetical protein ACRCXB_15045 [Aeromonadaceae bacterium]